MNQNKNIKFRTYSKNNDTETFKYETVSERLPDHDMAHGNNAIQMSAARKSSQGWYKLFVVVLLLFVAGYLLIFKEKPYGIGDRTGDFAFTNSINQIIVRGGDWKQIVFDSHFQIGNFEGMIDLREDGSVRQTYKLAPFGTYPNIDGSTVCIPMGAEFARQHLNMSDREARRFTDFNTTSVAYSMLIHRIETSRIIIDNNMNDSFRVAGVVDLILVTEPSDDELSQARQAGIELIIEPMCWDAFIFITHKENPVNSLTIEQIQKIYTGEITNWNEVGGLNQKIISYQREHNSGSQTTMEKQVMSGLPMIPAPMAKIAVGMGRLVDAVSEYVNEQYSIGYTFRYYIDNLYVSPNIKMIEIEGVAPTDENIRNKSYPFSTNYFVVFRSEDKDGVAGQFAEWILSEEGQECIAQVGYIPM